MARPERKDQYQELADFLKNNPHIDEVTKTFGKSGQTLTLKRNIQRLGELASQNKPIVL